MVYSFLLNVFKVVLDYLVLPRRALTLDTEVFKLKLYTSRYRLRVSGGAAVELLQMYLPLT